MKKNLLMLALMGAVSVGAFASQDAAVSAKKVEAPAKASEEGDFVSKLNEGNKKAFTAMTADQKKAAIAESAKVDANAAVEKVLAANATASAAKAEKPAVAEKPVSQAPAAAKPAAPQAK